MAYKNYRKGPGVRVSRLRTGGVVLLAVNADGKWDKATTLRDSVPVKIERIGRVQVDGRKLYRLHGHGHHKLGRAIVSVPLHGVSALFTSVPR